MTWLGLFRFWLLSWLGRFHTSKKWWILYFARELNIWLCFFCWHAWVSKKSNLRSSFWLLVFRLFWFIINFLSSKQRSTSRATSYKEASSCWLCAYSHPFAVAKQALWIQCWTTILLLGRRGISEKSSTFCHLLCSSGISKEWFWWLIGFFICLPWHTPGLRPHLLVTRILLLPLNLAFQSLWLVRPTKQTLLLKRPILVINFNGKFTIQILESWWVWLLVCVLWSADDVRHRGGGSWLRVWSAHIGCLWFDRGCIFWLFY